MREIILDGLPMEILDECSIFFLVYLKSENEYLIIRNDAIGEYTVLFNFEDKRDLAIKEFDNLKGEKV